MTNNKFDFIEIDKSLWPKDLDNRNVVSAYRSKEYLVQKIKHKEYIRLSINRIKHKIIKGKPWWDENISWDDLYAIKNALGYENQWLVECYPPEDDLENVACMRHLWVLPYPPEYGWHK